MECSQLTVIVPTRNEIHNIPAFLESLPADIPLIVVDASDDATPDLIARLRPLNTTIVRHPGHIAQARQIGADLARTPWLLFTDADVVFDAHYFTRLASYADTDALYGLKRSLGQFADYYRWFAWGQALFDHLGIPAISGSNLLIRQDILTQVGGFDQRLRCNEDSEIGFRLAKRGYRVGFAPDLVVYERDHRRLHRGTVQKTVHSLVRCALLYTGWMPDRWRYQDWGYWRAQRPDTCSPVESFISER